jgi:hypothetical protein
MNYYDVSALAVLGKVGKLAIEIRYAMESLNLDCHLVQKLPPPPPSLSLASLLSILVLASLTLSSSETWPLLSWQN